MEFRQSRELLAAYFAARQAEARASVRRSLQLEQDQFRIAVYAVYGLRALVCQRNIGQVRGGTNAAGVCGCNWRDALALDMHPGDLLPVDDSGYGFDNVGVVLSVSPTLLERYLIVSRMVSRLAVGDPTTKPDEEDFTPTEAQSAGGASKRRNERV